MHEYFITKDSISPTALAVGSLLWRIMVREALRFPAYGFDEHKGYGSPRHIQAIQTAGLCELHRHSFCKKFLA